VGAGVCGRVDGVAGVCADSVIVLASVTTPQAAKKEDFVTCHLLYQASPHAIAGYVTVVQEVRQRRERA
jgi:hypothetical protein